ncbi:MAG: hypothetical protein ACRD5G_13160, partial [Candidatus Acidiferrales bacterium]
AICASPHPKGEIVWDVDWNRFTLTRTHKLAVIDTGIGMTGEQMVHYINRLSSSMHAQSFEANFGVGAKIAAVPRNHAGLIYLSWKDGRGYMIHVWRDPATGVYGLRRFERPDGTAEYWTGVEDAIKPETIDKHGTMVILLGNSDEENTMQAPQGSPMPSRWILRYLNSRYYRFSKGVVVKAREGWELPKGDSHNFLRTVSGMKAWLEKNSTDSGQVELSGAIARWWILNENLDLDAGHHVSGGHVASLFQDELYELQAGRSGVARLQSFGVIFGHQRVVVYVEPRTDIGNRVVTTTARTSLLLNDESLPWTEWAAEFRAAIPQPIKTLVEELSATVSGSDHRQSIRERLKQIFDLLRVSRYRPVRNGAVMIEDSLLGGKPEERPEQKGLAKHSGASGGAGGRAGDIYALFQAVVGQQGEEIRTPVPEPTVKWISARDGTRTPPDLEDRAAKYIPQQNLLLINADFRIFLDMTERWAKKYSYVPGARAVVDSVVREWFEQQLVEAVMGSLGLRGSTQWTMQDLEKLWSEEGLTAAVLPRYHVDVNVRRTLGSKIGSLKDQVASA